MKKKARKRAQSRPPRRREAPTPAPGADAAELNAANRAQLGPDAEERPRHPPADDASVEDPLGDWPDER